MRKEILSLTVVLSMVIAVMPTFSLTASIDMLAKHNDGGTYTGGIVGSDYGVISDCISNCTLSSSTDEDYIGSIKKQSIV